LKQANASLHKSGENNTNLTKHGGGYDSKTSKSTDLKTRSTVGIIIRGGSWPNSGDLDLTGSSLALVVEEIEIKIKEDEEDEEE
jgi:hypothetical protein